MSDRIVARCTASDLEEIADLVNSAYRGPAYRGPAYRGPAGIAGWTSEIDMVEGKRTSHAALQADLAASPDAEILIMRQKDEMLACVRVERTKGPQGETVCYIGMLAVRPGLQDGGVGRAMLQEAELVGRGWGARVARMTVVSVRETLIAWYERRGYRRTGEMEEFPTAELGFGRPLRPDLEFAVLEKTLG